MIRILKGNHRNEQGLLERTTLMVEPTNDGFRDVVTGAMYKAQEYKAGNVTVIEIISKDTSTDVVYTAFIPDAGECERIGMPVARLVTASLGAEP